MDAKQGAGVKAIYIAARIICMASTIAVIAAVVWDFVRFNARQDSVVEKRSIVATVTMFLFFFVFYIVIVMRVGVVLLPGYVYAVLCTIGASLLALGAVVNILGRIHLGNRWSDHIKIYSDHSLVTGGIYSIVRHPLYASLIWMFYGASFVYANWIGFLLNTFIFIPMMYYRARQEEALLVDRFPEYEDYQSRVGMFFPKIFR